MTCIIVHVLSTLQLLSTYNNYRDNAVTNPAYHGDECKEDLDSEGYVVVTPRCEDNTQPIYEAISEIQEAKTKDETFPEHCYDDIISLKFAKLLPNKLEDSCTSKNVNWIGQNRSVLSASKPNAAQPAPVTKTHNDPSKGEHPPTQPITQSIHKRLLLRRRNPNHAAINKSQKPIILAPKPVKYRNTSATSHKAAGKQQKPPLPPKNITIVKHLAN